VEEVQTQRNDRAVKRKARHAFSLQPDDIIAEDHLKAMRYAKGNTERKADITLGDRNSIPKRPTVLGPILRQRFGEPSSSVSFAPSR